MKPNIISDLNSEPHHEPKKNERYRRENGAVVIEIAVKNSRQLFNESDPAPFRERDLDDDFVTYVVSSIQEFPVQTKMKLEIFMTDESDKLIDRTVIREAIRTYFEYETKLARSNLRKRLRMARFFFIMGFAALFICLGVAHFITSLQSSSPIIDIVREGFIISGWVAMWRPIEVLLYDWWPIRERRRYYDKIAKIDVAITGAPAVADSVTAESLSKPRM